MFTIYFIVYIYKRRLIISYDNVWSNQNYHITYENKPASKFSPLLRVYNKSRQASGAEIFSKSVKFRKKITLLLSLWLIFIGKVNLVICLLVTWTNNWRWISWHVFFVPILTSGGTRSEWRHFLKSVYFILQKSTFINKLLYYLNL